MSNQWLGFWRLATSTLALLLVAPVGTNAGGFAIREQGTYAQGASFAGAAAGGDLSAMYWNPAVMTQREGKVLELSASAILPYAEQNYTNSGLANALGGFVPGYKRNVPNSSNNGLVPSIYASWQLNPQLWLGMSVNSPFGLSVSFPQTWAGALYGQGADVKSFNVSPTVAFKMNDMVSIAAGVQVQYLKANYTLVTAVFPPQIGKLTADGYAYGFTVGATIMPTPTTTIGIGYRSALDQKISGTLEASTAGSTPGSISTTLKLPDMLTVGLRQDIGDRFTLLAGFEWSNWSRIGTSTVTTPSGTAMVSGSPVLLPFQYRDGYLYSVGGEYIVNPGLTVRAGVAIEQSPLTDAVRTPRLPDSDRIWYSAGVSYKPPQFHGVTFELAYSYVDFKDAALNLGPGTGNPWSNTTAVGPYLGSAHSNVSILSLALIYQWDAVTPKRVRR